ncbi:MAG: hypothetical protein Q9221_006984 [Calogaya cf. arnoldii]
MIPGGALGGQQSCTDQYPQNLTNWGLPYNGLPSAADCDKLPIALRSGCQWRFDWFGGADNPMSDYVQVECPAVITEKTGCSRKDEPLQLASALSRTPSPPSRPPAPSPPLASSPSPVQSAINSETKLVVAICVPCLTILLCLLWYYLQKRGRLRKCQTMASDKKVFPEPRSQHQQSDTRAQSVNSSPHTREVFPANIQDIGLMPETDTAATHELDITPGEDTMSGSKRWSIFKYNKPLPRLPVELKGSSICEELE